MNRKRLGTDSHPEIAANLSNLAFVLYAKGDRRAAVDMLRESLEMNRREEPPNLPTIAGGATALAFWLIDERDYDEAGRLVYMGVASTLPGDAAPRLVLDIGSASTELVLGQGAVVERIESFPVGALRQSLAFFPGGAIDAAGFDAALRSGRSRFGETALAGRCPPRAWGACGTVRALAEIAREDGLADGSLDMACLHALRGRFLAAGHLARIRLAWPAAARVPHLAGGLALLLALMEECGIETVLPAQAGLRVGAIWELHRRGRGISAPSA